MGAFPLGMLQKFLPMVGLFECECADGPIELVKTMLAARPSCSLKLAAAVLACMAGQTKSESCPAVATHAVPLHGDGDWSIVLMPVFFVAMVFLAIGLVAGWQLRGWWIDLLAPAAGSIAPRAVPAAAAFADAPRYQLALAAPALAAQPYRATTSSATKSTQSQTRYTYWTENPRFVPLSDREQGCWELAR